MSLSLANLKSLLRASLSVAYCTLKGPQLIKPILGLEKMPMPVVYRSVDSVLEVLEDKQYEGNENVLELLKIYKRTVREHSGNLANISAKKHPLIILEGLDGSGKTTVTRKLILQLNGVKWCTPPNDIRHIRDYFDDHPNLRTAYYALGNYIAALQISTLLKRKLVVMDRYWHSTAAYAISQWVEDNPDKAILPPIGDEFYMWPSDLLKPDYVFFLKTSETVRLQRHSRRNTTNTNQEQLLKTSDTFRRNVVRAYERMQGPSVIMVNSDGTVEECIESILKRIKTN